MPIPIQSNQNMINVARQAFNNFQIQPKKARCKPVIRQIKKNTTMKQKIMNKLFNYSHRGFSQEIGYGRSVEIIQESISSDAIDIDLDNISSGRDSYIIDQEVDKIHPNK